MTKKIVQKIVLGGVVIKDGRVLILQRHKDEEVYPNIWELPSGKRELLELTEISLIREVKEETNLDVEIIVPISVFDYQIKKPEEIRDSIQINFLVKPLNNQEVLLSKEHQAFAWIDKNEINNFNITKATKKVIKKAFKIIQKT